MGFLSKDDDEDCQMDDKTNEFLCRRGKSAVLMKATKEGMKVIHTKGEPKVVDEMIERMSSKSRIKTKDDI